MEAFTACAVSDKKCVPQRVDADAFPVPKVDSLDEGFDLNNFQARALRAPAPLPPSWRSAALQPPASDVLLDAPVDGDAAHGLRNVRHLWPT